MKNFLENGEWARSQKKDKTERVAGLGRRTREEIVKWNQTTALRFQAVGGGASDIPVRYPRPPFGGERRHRK